MTPYGKGFSPPDWMDSHDSIEAVGSIYRNKLPPLYERFSGVLCLASTVSGLCVSVEDRASGKVYYRCATEQPIGSVIVTNWICMTSSAPEHGWKMHMMIARRVEVSEVRRLADQNASGTPTKIEDGWWYEVKVD